MHLGARRPAQAPCGHTRAPASQTRILRTRIPPVRAAQIRPPSRTNAAWLRRVAQLSILPRCFCFLAIRCFLGRTRVRHPIDLPVFIPPICLSAQARAGGFVAVFRGPRCPQRPRHHPALSLADARTLFVPLRTALDHLRALLGLQQRFADTGRCGSWSHLIRVIRVLLYPGAWAQAIYVRKAGFRAITVIGGATCRRVKLRARFGPTVTATSAGTWLELLSPAHRVSRAASGRQRRHSKP